MAALTAITPTPAGVSSSGTAVSASDTISQAILGQRGAYLEVINAGGSTDTVTVKDFGSTDSGNSLPSNQYTVSVTAGSSQVIWIKPYGYDPSSSLLTVTHSFTTSVTCKLYPVQ